MRTDDVQKILEDHGWRVIRETGNHKMLKKGQAKIPFAYHDREIGPTQIRKLARRFGVDFGFFFKPIELKSTAVNNESKQPIPTIPYPVRTPRPAVEGPISGDTTLQYLEVKTLYVDRSYQRPLNAKWARELAAKWDDRLLGIMTVSQRPDGAQFLLEGQHRSAALVARGEGDRKVPVLVFKGLSLKEEADIYLGRNNVKLSTSLALFHAKLQAQEPAAMEIDRIVREIYKLEIGKGGKYGVQAIGALARLQEWGVLSETMYIWHQAWGDKSGFERSNTLRSPILLGIGAMVMAYKEELDQKRLSAVLRPYSGLELMHMVLARSTGRAKGVLASYVTMIDVMRLIYNHRMKAHALPSADLTPRNIADWTAKK